MSKVIIAKIDVACRFCKQTTHVIKYGKHPCGAQRYRCVECRKIFSPDYIYEACKSGVKEKIVEMSMNNTGIWDTGHVLKVGNNIVLGGLKKLSSRSVTSLPFNKDKIELIFEVDDQSFFVRKKPHK